MKPLDRWKNDLFNGLFPLGFLVDIYLAGVLKVPTISERVWAVCSAHPIVAVFGIALTLLACYGLRHSWWRLACVGVLGGHLFTQL